MYCREGRELSLASKTPFVLWNLMPKLRSCVGILFVISLIIGGYLGYLVIEGIQNPELPDTTMISPKADQPTTNTEPEETILVLGVDDLTKPMPSLEGAWLVTLYEKNQLPDTIHFGLITLYPVTSNSMLFPLHSQFAQPHPPILINPENLSAVSGIDPISFSQGQWSSIIVFDEVLMNIAVTLQIPNAERPFPTPSDDLFTKPWIDPVKAYHQQVGIITTLCEHPEPFSQPNLVIELLSMEGDHIKTSLPEGGLLRLWQAIDYTQQKRVTCTVYPE
jgi:hypothetical protein